MPKSSIASTVTNWLARIAGALFLLVVAVGWWDESQARQDPTGDMPQDFFFAWAVYTHLLPLSLITAGYVVGISKPLIAAIAFGIFAALQAISVGSELIYLPLVVMPPLVVGVLFLLAWLFKKKSQSA
jgi:hypothetical protein